MFNKCVDLAHEANLSSIFLMQKSQKRKNAKNVFKKSRKFLEKNLEIKNMLKTPHFEL